MPVVRHRMGMQRLKMHSAVVVTRAQYWYDKMTNLPAHWAYRASHGHRAAHTSASSRMMRPKKRMRRCSVLMVIAMPMRNNWSKTISLNYLNEHINKLHNCIFVRFGCFRFFRHVSAWIKYESVDGRKLGGSMLAIRLEYPNENLRVHSHSFVVEIRLWFLFRVWRRHRQT